MAVNVFDVYFDKKNANNFAEFYDLIYPFVNFID